MELFFLFAIISYCIVSLACYIFSDSELTLLLVQRPTHTNAIEFYKTLKKVSFIPLINVLLFFVIAIDFIFIQFGKKSTN